MANQITIDIGAAANDGTGDPLRTAFNYVNNNFSNVWNTGLPNSNIQFSDNRILTVNTNANLVLAPNGVGKVASNVDIVPNTANVFSLGGSTRRWNTIYGQYLDLSHNATIGGNLTVTGNLSAGNISYTSNVFVGDLEGSVFDGASSIVLDVIDSAIYVDNYRYANGSPVTFGGTPGGSNTQIQFNNAGSFGGSAAFTFNRTSNVLTVNGNISAGNVFTTNTITAHDAYISTGTFAGDTNTGDAALYVGAPTYTILGTDVMAQFTGNVTTYAQINLQNWGNSPTSSGDYILTADNGNDSTHFLDMGITSSTWDGSLNNVLSGLAPNNGYLYVQDGDLTLGTRAGNVSYSWKFDTTGNLTVAGNIIPTGNNTQSLGNATRQWNDLYLSNATIFMNSVPISMTAGNVLTVNGNAVLQNNSNSTITTTGNITADTFFGSGVTAGAANAVVSLNAFDTDGNTVSIQAQGNTAAAVIETYFEGANNRFTWSFDNSGTLTFPASQTSIFGGYDNDLTINTSNTGNAAYTFTFSQFGDLSVPVNLDVSGNVYTNDIVGPSAGNVAITANTQSWLFDNNGTLTLPGNSQILPAGNTGVRLSAGASDATGLFLNNTGDAEIYANSNVSVYTDAGNIGWTFGIDGNVTIPGSILGTSTVAIDNRGTGNTADIQLYSADDILLQARDRTIGDDIEGGDINIYAGSGSPDNAGGGTGGGGDVTINGGAGGVANISNGGAGGFVRLDAGGGGGGSATASAGRGGDAWLSAGSAGSNNGGGGNAGGNVTITAGDTTAVAQDRGSIILNAGAGGDETTVGGYVRVHIPSVGANPGGDWTFTGSGLTLEPPPNAEIFNPSLGNLTVGTVGNTIVRNIGGVTTYDWVFDPTGNLNLPNNGSINFNAGGIVQATDEDFVITVNDADDDGFAIFNRITDTDGNVVGQTELRRDRLNINLDMLGSNYQWQFSDNQGVMYLPGNISGNYGSDTSFFVTDNGSGGTMEMKTISYIGDTLGSNVRVTQSNATISTSNAAYTWTFDNTGNLTVPGNTIVSTANATGGLGGKNISITAGASDAVTWNSNPGGNVNITGGYGSFGDGGGGPGGNVNITSGGSSDSHAGNVTINSGANAWNFDYTGNLDAPGNITATNFVGNGAALTNVATQVTGSWTLAAGTNTANITVPPNGTYTIWVNGNIPNGIAVWNATVTITNNNVPVIGQQFAWNYSGNALVITSIPSQIIGTAGAISNASPGVGTTTNVFEFSIDNNSGNSAVVNYGYTKL
jgi:hypothetical protein